MRSLPRMATAATGMLAICALLAGCPGGTEGTSDTTGDVPSDGLSDGSSDIVEDVVTDADIDVTDEPDDGPPDVFPDIDPDPGEFLYPCETDSECFSGYCIDSPEGTVCSKTCNEYCPAYGWSCRQDLSQLPDVLFLCQPTFPTLCYPCRANDDCRSTIDNTPHACIPTGDQGAFCGGSCATTGCPDGYICSTVADVTGAASKQCVREDGVCECSQGAIDAGASTDCSESNAFGQCAGERACGEDGLSACTAATPAEDVCNGVDDDCDGEVDDGFVSEPCSEDNDFGVCEGELVCGGEDGVSCSAPVPAAESCNGTDDDCDGDTDEEDADGCTTYYADADGDGHGVDDVTACLCGPQGAFTAAAGGDCDDGNKKVSPDGSESCNGLDDDCNGETDELGAAGCTDFHADADGDGFGDPDDSSCLCVPAAPYTTTDDSDCDDSGSSVSPAASEVCGDGVDNDCDGATDEEGAAGCVLYFADSDGDSFGNPGDFACLCAPADPYVVTAGGDCDDGEGAINPGLTEACGDGVDNDCDGLIDEAGADGCETYYLDADGDDFGVIGDTRCLCAPEGDYTTQDSGDCNDNAPSAFPGATELCNGIDDDCNDFVDEPGADGCTVFFKDNDLDSFGVPGESACLCAAEIPYLSDNEDDCDDTNPFINGDAVEKCNGLDDDCNGQTDEGVAGSCTSFYKDADKDGWGTGEPVCLCSPDGEYTATKTGDCDDGDSTRFPQAQELCNGADDDCDSETDEQDALGCQLYFKDGDEDTFGVSGDSRCLCAPGQPGGYTSQIPGDCDDGDGAVKLGALEVCDGVDNDCDGATDEPGADGCTDYLLDTDGDTWGVASDTQCLCAPTAPYTASQGGDCEDASDTINPGQDEVCDGVDNDCNGVADDPGIDGCVTFYRDTDGDTFGVAGEAQCLCNPSGTFTATQTGDCDDLTASTNPLATEQCNGKDDDCNGQTDEQGSVGCVSFLLDVDGDGFGVDGNAECHCAATATYRALQGGDCVDADEDIFPGALETCDGFDNDCDGATDDAGSAGCTVWYKDGDDDTFGVDGDSQCLCAPGDPYDAAGAGDCDDTSAAVKPTATEICNGVDDDCNGVIDDAGTAGCTVFFRDADGDGYGVTGDSQCLCAAAGLYTAAQGGDCDDTLGTVNPVATETCNGVDDDCNSQTDEAGSVGCADFLRDEDGDSFGVTGDSQCLCAPGPVYRAFLSGDCDDLVAGVNPGAVETCNGSDDDCDSQTDEAGSQGCSTWYKDGDDDTFGVSDDSQCLCAATDPYDAASGGDCDDAVAAVKPGVTEVCDGIDNNCDGFVDEAGSSGCTVFFEDADGDGYGSTNSLCLCAAAAAYTASQGGDCDDADPLRNPGLTEACNGIDDDCNSQTDEAGATGCVVYYEDVDDDTFGKDGTAQCLCAATGDQTALVPGDCDDGADTVNPAEDEVCDAIDNQCDAVVDEGCGLPTQGWPTHMYDARRTGHTMQVDMPDSPAIRWSTTLSSGWNIRNSPVITVGGDIVASAADQVFRLDPANGNVTASYTLPSDIYPFAGPTLRQGGTVVVTAGTTLVMLTPDLQEIWSTDLGSALVSTPIVDPNGNIYVVSATALHRVGPDGVQDWSEAVANDADTPSHPAIGINGRIYFTAADHKIYAIDPTASAGNRLVFALQPPSMPGSELTQPVDGSVTISELSTIYAAFGEEIFGVTIAGTEVYNRDLNVRIRAGIAIHNTGYQCCNPEEFLWANPVGTEPLYKHEIDLTPDGTSDSDPQKPTNRRTSTPVFDRNGDVVVGADDGRLWAFTQGTGNKWNSTFGGSFGAIDGTAAIGDDIIVIGDATGTLFCIEE